jgi:hypothetical protein
VPDASSAEAAAVSAGWDAPSQGIAPDDLVPVLSSSIE